MWLVIGAFFGAVAATLIAPWMLETLLATTGAKDAMCQCTELVANTASHLIRTQIYGAVAGAITFPIGAFVARRLWGRRDAAVPPAIGGTPSPSSEQR
jgi:hypothetical protein